MKEARALGGARPHARGLHLGHLIGCFMPRELPPPAVSRYLFVIADCDVTISRRKATEFARDAYAAADVFTDTVGDRVNVVLESEIRTLTAPLVARLQRTLTFAQLRRVNPNLRSGNPLTVSEAMFPLYQAAYTLLLGTEWVYMNADNERIVDLTRTLARRGGIALQPRLAPAAPTSRPLGWDGRRMSRANQNVLSIRADASHARRYLSRFEPSSPATHQLASALGTRPETAALTDALIETLGRIQDARSARSFETTAARLEEDRIFAASDVAASSEVILEC